MNTLRALPIFLLCGLLFGITSAQDFFLLAQTGSGEEIQVAITAGADLNAADAYGQTPLMYAVEGNTPEAVQALINSGADVNARTRANWTPLMYAARNPDAEIANLLLMAGADPYATGDEGVTALQISITHNHNAVAELLNSTVEYEADTYSQGDTIQVNPASGDSLRVREEPGLQATSVISLPGGTRGVIVSGTPIFMDGYWWWNIRFENGAEGWSAQGTASEQYFVISHDDPGADNQGATQQAPQSRSELVSAMAALVGNDTRKFPTGSQFPFRVGSAPGWYAGYFIEALDDGIVSVYVANITTGEYCHWIENLTSRWIYPMQNGFPVQGYRTLIADYPEMAELSNSARLPAFVYANSTHANWTVWLVANPYTGKCERHVL